jgi:hypothetical protein
MEALRSPEVQQRIGGIVNRLLDSLGDAESLSDYRAIVDVNEKIFSLMDGWAREEIEELVSEPMTVGGAASLLAQIHREISGAERVEAVAGARSINLAVTGCPGYELCRVKPRGGWCWLDMVLSAIIQRAMETPVTIHAAKDGGVCLHGFEPAWLAELLADLEGLDVEALSVMSGDRLVFFHAPTEESREALSEGILFREENPPKDAGESPHGPNSRQIASGDRRMLLITAGGTSMAIYPRPRKGNEEKIKRKILRAMADL